MHIVAVRPSFRWDDTRGRTTSGKSNWELHSKELQNWFQSGWWRRGEDSTIAGGAVRMAGVDVPIVQREVEGGLLHLAGRYRQYHLESLSGRFPESRDHILALVYLASFLMARQDETVPACEDTWMECLGDLGRYRMAHSPLLCPTTAANDAATTSKPIASSSGMLVRHRAGRALSRTRHHVTSRVEWAGENEARSRRWASQSRPGERM